MMNRHSTLFSAPAAGFDQPFEMLLACHERVERSLALLLRLGAHVEENGCDTQARDAARDVLRYFDIAAPLHHEDEERHVLPQLVMAGEDALASRLLADHRAMEDAWAKLRPALASVETGGLAADALPAARAQWAAFASLYREHSMLEESRAFPVARRDLAPGEEQGMGEEMARRRGAPVPPLNDGHGAP